MQANARCGTTGINTLRGAPGAITALALRNNTNVTAAPGRRGGIGPVCSACRRGGYLLALVAPGAANSHFLHRPLGGTLLIGVCVKGCTYTWYTYAECALQSKAKRAE